MSVTQVRRERERAAREGLIIDHARRLLLRKGFQELNLDELAREVEYSKGTIYLHFTTKEDLALAVATRALQERAELFERASKFAGRTRERMRAIGFACCQFAVMHSDIFSIEIMLKSQSFWGQASEERRRQHSVVAGRTFGLVNAICHEAIAVGDLPRSVKAADVTLSLISVTIGSHIASMQPDIQVLCGLEDLISPVRRNQDLICDGWGWKPLLKDHDFSATDRRIKAEVFPEASWFKS